MGKAAEKSQGQREDTEPGKIKGPRCLSSTVSVNYVG